MYHSAAGQQLKQDELNRSGGELTVLWPD